MVSQVNLRFSLINGSPGVIIWGEPVSVEASVSWLVFRAQIDALDKEAAGDGAGDWADGFRMTLCADARAPGKCARRARFCT